jgi:hypothetical protein
MLFSNTIKKATQVLASTKAFLIELVKPFQRKIELKTPTLKNKSHYIDPKIKKKNMQGNISNFLPSTVCHLLFIWVKYRF